MIQQTKAWKRTSLRKMMERLRVSASHTKCAPHPFLAAGAHGHDYFPVRCRYGTIIKASPTKTTILGVNCRSVCLVRPAAKSASE